jgi:hypothetical protein
MARQRLEGGGHGLVAGVGETLAEGEADGDGTVPTGGVELQADVISAVTASALIQWAAFMSLQQ